MWQEPKLSWVDEPVAGMTDLAETRCTAEASFGRNFQLR